MLTREKMICEAPVLDSNYGYGRAPIAIHSKIHRLEISDDSAWIVDAEAETRWIKDGMDSYLADLGITL
ncbi:hypothetical protein [Deinococcus radiopugnans]|uniref:hypothetical protein n=1 Tax=Deinococcus radiopugnans TaxID=57497 RepID=UPI0012E06E7A|nr:hypothetical protein [Deinococcus radiopugnans]